MPDTPPEAQEEQPQAPRAVCPLQTCDYSLPYPPSGNIEELFPELKAHGDTHTADEFLHTIGILQNGLWEAHEEIAELQSALRGANFIMQANGILPPAPGSREESLAEQAGGLLIPDHVARELAAEKGQTTHTVGTAKHGDVVPGKGTLVGKKITDPMVLRDLKKGEDEHGK